MRSYKEEAIIIKRKNYAEADRIITLFTKHRGKIQVKATGVRKIASRRSPHIELLNHANVSLYQRNNNMSILTEAQTVHAFADIKNDLQKVGFAYHICELVDGLCPDDQENFAVYNLLMVTLHQLEAGEDIAPIIHDFEIELLTILGFWQKGAAIAKNLDTQNYIENILERKLKSRKIFAKIQ